MGLYRISHIVLHVFRSQGKFNRVLEQIRIQLYRSVIDYVKNDHPIYTKDIKGSMHKFHEINTIISTDISAKEKEVKVEGSNPGKIFQRERGSAQNSDKFMSK